MVLPETRARDAARRRAAARRGGAARRVDRQPARPALDLRPGARGRGALRPVACGHARGTVPRTGPERTGRGRRSRTSAAARATSAASFGTCPSGPSPVWLRARLTNAGMRPISNVVDVTNYVMLGAREPAARVRPGEARRRPDRRPPRAARRDDPHARRRRAEARARGPDDRRRRTLGRARRDHGRRGDRDLGRDDRGAARGRELRADRDLPHLRAAAPAHRGLEPLGEGRRPVPRRARREPRHAAARRDRRRELGRPTPTCTRRCPSGR